MIGMATDKPTQTVRQAQLVLEAEALLAHDPEIRDAVTRAVDDVAAGRSVPMISVDDLLAESKAPARDLP